ncbi:uncharacterized protein LOC135200864 isoform X4 [Macrobrachium nipponense]|uniref:uncharacterized protein LOC135200864 isoform X4 n=1 Tax=Macrobrachium nipponense TaxID=159736 RepID=UPI0030C81EA1
MEFAVSPRSCKLEREVKQKEVGEGRRIMKMLMMMMMMMMMRTLTENNQAGAAVPPQTDPGAASSRTVSTENPIYGYVRY